jgi:hypothetical protein
MLLVACFSKNAAAQWTDMTWEINSLGFKAPTNFTISKSDANTFTASGSIFTMNIESWEYKDGETPIEICQTALDNVQGSDKKIIEESAIDDQNGLEGYEAYCTAVQDGKLMHMVLGGYQDPILFTNFSVQLLFWDDPAQNDLNYKAALYILRSLKILD